MSEEKIVEVVNQALAAAGIEDTVTAAGEFEPRGHAATALTRGCRPVPGSVLQP